MSSARIFVSLRACTSLSSTPLRRPPPRPPRAVFSFGTRHYSANKPPHQEEAGKSEGTGNVSEAPPNDVESDLLAKLKVKEDEAQDLTGRLRYLQADFLNLQRNAAREKEHTRDYAITRFAFDLLETVDVLEMALKSVPPSVIANQNSTPTTQAPTTEAPTSSETPVSNTPAPGPPTDPPQKSPLAYLSELHTGVELTHRLLQQTLFKYHVKPFDPTGDKFDPNLHEALFQVPVPGKEPGTVIACQKIGYMIKDRVLRAPQVGVAQEANPEP